jgi:uncharacterized protein YdeI (YjbR/CyaY-like superfamily)
VLKGMQQETLYVTERKDWRNWLAKNFDKKEEIWLIYPKKITRKSRIEYNTAVEEALCFGWIDSTVKTFDSEHSMQRFSIRKTKTSYSQANKERLKWLFANNLIHPTLTADLEKVIAEEFHFPEDVIAQIKKDQLAWQNYTQFSDPYKRIRIAYIDSARKRPEDFEKRLQNFIVKTREGKTIKGFGGIDKYYELE